MLENLEGLTQAFFFKGMLAGYANSGETRPHPLMTGWKRFTFTETGGHGFRLEDSWCDTGGRTLIHLGDFLVWTMRYEGVYQTEAVPFLKKALMQSYSSREFVGGRGPGNFSENNYTYRNSPNPSSNFRRFSGKETVYIEKGKTNYKMKGPITSSSLPSTLYDGMLRWARENKAGTHDYWGGMLV